MTPRARLGTTDKVAIGISGTSQIIGQWVTLFTSLVPVAMKPAAAVGLALLGVAAAAVYWLWRTNQELERKNQGLAIDLAEAQRQHAQLGVDRFYANQTEAKSDVAAAVDASQTTITVLGTRMNSFTELNEPFRFLLSKRDKRVEFLCMNPDADINKSSLMERIKLKPRDQWLRILDSTKDNIVILLEEEKKYGNLDVWMYHCDNSFRLIITDDVVFVGFVDDSRQGKDGAMFAISKKTAHELHRWFVIYAARVKLAARKPELEAIKVLQVS